MMNSRHLPAGQGMAPDVGRRRGYNQHPHSHQHQQQHAHQQHQQAQYPPPQMYNSYMQPYNANYYPQQLPPQYHNPGMQHQYSSYPQYTNVRSPPPPMQHYPSVPIPQHQIPYSRALPAANVLVPFQPPTVPTPSSTQSSLAVPAPTTPPTPALAVSVPPVSSAAQVLPIPPVASPVPVPEAKTRPPFTVPLPWFSHPDEPFPTRKPRRKRRNISAISAETVELPHTPKSARVEETREAEATQQENEVVTETSIIRPETPATISEDNTSTNPTTPSSLQQPVAGDITPVAPKPVQKQATVVVPVVPALPKSLPREVLKNGAEKNVAEAAVEEPKAPVEESEPKVDTAVEEVIPQEAPAPLKAWTTPKLWTGLFVPDAAAAAAVTSNESGQNSLAPNGAKPASESLAEALRSFNPSAEAKVSFLEPRGLVNTGNMCYMNSVLQVLVSCTPFYNFLDQVSKKAAHSFKSETPLLDAMILFMREFKVIDSAASVEKLRLRLKEGELEQYGDAFTPDFVYNVINRLPRFSSMRQGHQQDAEEFLGFLLDGLHEECGQVMRSSISNTTSAAVTPTNVPTSPISEVNTIPESLVEQENGWLEVGPKQKSAVTRSSGTITTGSPLTKIFGGNLRSELRVPGLKDSVTLEPYQPLQLDIGAPNVNNIIDALKGLTRSESLHGDFKSPKGPNVTATKQVFIETLPSVLILHLKRFQYDNAGGTQKIWKKVGYPLELEIPKEVFPRQKRGVYAHSGLPKYRLIAVVYHHGKNASGGHYTVDVRRQEGREWVRLDDTVIRRVRSEEVAEGGSEEDPKVIAAALEAHKRDPSVKVNGFAAIDGVEEENGEEGWKKASGPGKKWSAVANGVAAPKTNGAQAPKAKSDKFSVKDNKVAYLLFYQKI